MRDFTYICPETIDEVCQLLSEQENAFLIAGGQSLLPLLRLRAADLSCLIDINGLKNANYITFENQQVKVGPTARHAEVAESETVKNHCLVLSQVAAHIGDVQVRNRGTICGSVANADPAGDPPVLSALLDVEIQATSVRGETIYSGSDFFQGFYATNLEEDEFITEVRFPEISSPTGVGYEKWEPSEGAYPVATVGALITLEGDLISQAKIVTGAIDPGPTFSEDAATILIGQKPTTELITEAAISVGENSDPIEDAEGSILFKQELMKTLSKRAITTAVDCAQGGA